jgi:diguanylate cyclase (GGDEF) domain
MQNAYQLQCYFFCLVCLLILWLACDRRRRSREDPDTRIYRAMIASTFALIVCDSVGLLFEGRPGGLARVVVIASNTAYFTIHALPIPLAILYADYQLFRDRKRIERISRRLAILVAAIMAAAILTPFFGLIFFVDESNNYVRGPLFFCYAGLQFLLSACLIAHILRNRKRVSRRIFIVLAAYPIPMVVAAGLQTAFQDLTLLWPTMTLFLVTVAFNIENRRSKTDYLTGTANRRSLDEELERRVKACDAEHRLFGLLMDIDGFKSINDELGHEAGDRALEDVAAILLDSVRVEDLVARMGGDEFVVLASSGGSFDLEGLSRRVELTLERLNDTGRRPYTLALSIGRAEYDYRAAPGAAAFLSLLDADMYARKKERGASR